MPLRETATVLPELESLPQAVIVANDNAAAVVRSSAWPAARCGAIGTVGFVVFKVASPLRVAATRRRLIDTAACTTFVPRFGAPAFRVVRTQNARVCSTRPPNDGQCKSLQTRHYWRHTAKRIRDGDSCAGFD